METLPLTLLEYKSYELPHKLSILKVLPFMINKESSRKLLKEYKQIKEPIKRIEDGLEIPINLNLILNESLRENMVNDTISLPINKKITYRGRITDLIEEIIKRDILSTALMRDINQENDIIGKVDEDIGLDYGSLILLNKENLFEAYKDFRLAVMLIPDEIKRHEINKILYGIKTPIDILDLITDRFVKKERSAIYKLVRPRNKDKIFKKLLEKNPEETKGLNHMYFNDEIYYTKSEIEYEKDLRLSLMKEIIMKLELYESILGGD
jgi:hypothetical protein